MVSVETAPGTRVATDLALGGRWTSLRIAGREWLWSREDPRRARARPGDRFVDAGGIEECVPTVRGEPDHGSAWTRAWQATGSNASAVDCACFALRRRIVAGPNAVTATYRLTAAPGFRFVWAAHALLDLSAAATVSLPIATPVRLYPEAAPYLAAAWPDAAPYVTCEWPGAGRLRLDRLGPDDGTAVGAVAVGCRRVTVVDGADRLEMELTSDAAVSTSIAIWRNLRGFPAERPYRSVGVEPMLGSVFDRAEATGARDAVTVPASGTVEWQLHLSAVVG